MAVTTLIDDERKSLVYHPDSKVIHHRMKTNLRGNEFRELLSTGAEYLVENRATKWLSDDRDGGVVAPDDNEWGDTVWAPRVIKAGFKFWAIVAPENAVGSMQMRRFAEEYRRRGVTVKVFTNVDDALGWLDAAG